MVKLEALEKVGVIPEFGCKMWIIAFFTQMKLEETI